MEQLQLSVDLMEEVDQKMERIQMQDSVRKDPLMEKALMQDSIFLME